MVLGLRSKSRKCVAVEVVYLIHVQQIKPWPQGQFLRSGQSVLVQWSNSDQNSGSYSCGVMDDKIEINESFKLPVTLLKEASKKQSSHEGFQKNLLEFQIFESLKDKPVRGQLLGSATINLADYGTSGEIVNLNAPVKCKKSWKNIAQPLLYVSIEPFDRDSCNSSPKSSISKDYTLEKGGNDSVSVRENDDEVEIAPFTDDDEDENVPAHLSRVMSSAVGASHASVPQNGQEETGVSESGKYHEFTSLSTAAPLVSEKYIVENNKKSSSSSLSSVDLPPNLDYPIEAAIPDRNEQFMGGGFKQETPTNQLYQKTAAESDGIGEIIQEPIRSEDIESISSISSSIDTHFLEDASSKVTSTNFQAYQKTGMHIKYSLGEAFSMSSASDPFVEKSENEQPENELSETTSRAKKHFSKDKLAPSFLRRTTKKQVTFRKGASDDYGSIAKGSEPRKEKSTHLATDLAGKSPENDARWKSKVALLEDELREAAAMEASLYSVVAEHGSSSSKVHCPARRLCRFYFYACRANAPSKRAAAAQAIVSGLVLVSKACGNDVPRLTFWLSNAIILRATISQASGKWHGGGNSCVSNANITNGSHEVDKPVTLELTDDGEDSLSFTTTLEKIEGWMFSRIVESVWWQTMTPHMQPSAVKGSSSRKNNGRKYALDDQQQGNFSIDLWKKAFKDACERLCPLRAGGHECRCLPLLSRLVMEQLLHRLDVAMFNAILRESADEMPTDPVSDPIMDPKVLPIPAGKSGFRAGAQLKNAVGNWSRWLSDLFDIDDDDSGDSISHVDDNQKQEPAAPIKAFHLLNALSDLMMLPPEMLADKATRKEVCPLFGVPVIKRVLYNFVPDEFCPRPVDPIIDELDSEDIEGGDTEPISSIPCVALPSLYTPPVASALTAVIGDAGSLTPSKNGLSMLKKSYNSDDELDELDSPISSIVIDGSRVGSISMPPNLMLNEKGGRKVARYQLLREIWRECE